MAMSFFPSRQIGLYMAKLFLVRTFAVLLMLVLILQTLDLLGESGKILGVPGNGEGDLWRYIGMRVPQLIQRFLPFSVLLGTLITFTTLSQNSEVVSMKAAGLSAHQILAPMIFASLFVAGLSFVFNDRIVAPASSQLKKWQDVEYGQIPKDDGVRYNVWVREGRDFVQARTVLGKDAATILQDVRVYQRTSGSLTNVIRADSARYIGGAWALSNVRIFNVKSAMQERVDTLTIGRGIEPKRFDQKKIDGDAMGFFQLQRAIAERKAAGGRTDALEGNLWHKIAGPLSAILMPLLGAVAAFGLARSGALFLRAVIGMALGFAYFVADNFALAMGNLGAYPPYVAAWAPFLLFLLIGETVLVRTEE
jgi:lipopolysaccharide export system permease protein